MKHTLHALLAQKEADESRPDVFLWSLNSHRLMLDSSFNFFTCKKDLNPSTSPFTTAKCPNPPTEFPVITWMVMYAIQASVWAPSAPVGTHGNHHQLRGEKSLHTLPAMLCHLSKHTSVLPLSPQHAPFILWLPYQITSRLISAAADLMQVRSSTSAETSKVAHFVKHFSLCYITLGFHFSTREITFSFLDQSYFDIISGNLLINKFLVFKPRV